ncbi:MAG TPA: hypothetical protein PLX03_01795, partial [Candidatus Hydrogenedentes bacterium]|nr:hypothetical protein [Candidatus Hydrogenedentota bacterium]
MTFRWILICGFAACAAMTVGSPFTAAAEEELAPLNIELPEPFFGGTPIDYWSENLEPEDFKDRPPFMAPKGTEIISRGKKVTSSDKNPSLGNLGMIVDGDKNYAKNSLVELGEGVQWIQIDLEKSCEIYPILIWHFHEGKRVY